MADDDLTHEPGCGDRHACGAIIGAKLVIADDGEPAIIAWCHQCDTHTGGPVGLDDVPELQAQLVEMEIQKRSGGGGAVQ